MFLSLLSVSASRPAWTSAVRYFFVAIFRRLVAFFMKAPVETAGPGGYTGNVHINPAPMQECIR
jgi:hypothetical protein